MRHVDFDLGVAGGGSAPIGHVVEVELRVVHRPRVDARFDDRTKIGAGDLPNVADDRAQMRLWKEW